MSTKLDEYEEVRVLGQGAFGKAILVYHKGLNKNFVMKVIAISNMKQTERAEALREAEVLKQFDHPNIVKYVATFMDKRNLYIVMEYADGGDIHQLIEDQKKSGVPMPEDQIMFYFVQILLALKHVHDKKTLHRDLKGQNIFLNKLHAADGKVRLQVKLGDFGVSKVLQSTLEQAQTAVGTPYYLSPEICNQKGYNNKSDVWSLGCILYELCTQQHVFYAQNLKMLLVKILDGKYQPIPSTYSKELQQIVAYMLQKDPNNRPSVAQLVQNPLIAKWIPRLLPADVIKREFPVPKSPSVESKTPSEQIPKTPKKNENSDFGDEVNQGANQVLNSFMNDLKNMKTKDSLGFKLEKTRVFLEKELGLDKFIEVYQLVENGINGGQEQIDQNKIQKVLGAKQGFVNLVVQLLLMENEANQM
ncbi:Kinase [Hexamita inflata]|uniref:non-specific serine/threonine protein kinase n=1 Tax=Hexamita inflata TaxID=28002 RepID=A0AA86QCE1_9EUKA|nr:Kinase [Hexamita inflata]